MDLPTENALKNQLNQKSTNRSFLNKVTYLSFRTTKMLVYNLARKKKSLKKHGIYILNIYNNSNDTRILINLNRFGSGHFLDD